MLWQLDNPKYSMLTTLDSGFQTLHQNNVDLGGFVERHLWSRQREDKSIVRYFQPRMSNTMRKVNCLPLSWCWSINQQYNRFQQTSSQDAKPNWRARSVLNYCWKWEQHFKPMIMNGRKACKHSYLQEVPRISMSKGTYTKSSNVILEILF